MTKTVTITPILVGSMREKRCNNCNAVTFLVTQSTNQDISGVLNSKSVDNDEVGYMHFVLVYASPITSWELKFISWTGQKSFWGRMDTHWFG
jgi:hypothetical protein